jgi:hypothetical protein
MNRKTLSGLFLLGFALASAPAYASPFKKQTSLDCSAMAGDNIVVNTTVSLCAAAAGPCLGDTFPCPVALACDSDGIAFPTSESHSCSAPFKVAAVGWNATWTIVTPLATSTGGSIGAKLIQKGSTLEALGDLNDIGLLKVK